MFQKARIKLTAWYLLIIMLVSMSFSAVIFRVLTSELDRFERVERVRIERRFPAIDEIKHRLILRLININVFIFVGSALAGYLLAGRTLKPIAEMVDEQNRFITDASHELRTPLTSLKSEIEVNLRDPNLSMTQAKSLLKSNLEEVNNLQTLSDNLIKLTGNNTLDMGRIQLTDIIKEAIRRVSVAAKTKRIMITNNVPNHVLTGNAMLLTELFIILLDNAIKYSARGKNIRITGGKNDGHVSIRVTDQGYGIRKEDIPHLFDRFWRADKSRTKTAVPGYGLGLAIGKQIVDRHHGMITVESAVNKGSVFMVTLPA
jgi:signal transduction histidine kinase